MTNKLFGVAASFALAANAFMIPSTMSLPELKEDGLDALKAFDPLGQLHDAKARESGRVTRLECPGCQLAGAEGVPMSLILNWTFSENGKVLNLNDKPFLGVDIIDFSEAYNAPQIPAGVPDSMLELFTSGEPVAFLPDDDTHEQIKLLPQDISYRASKRQIPATDDTDAQLIDVDFQVVMVAGSPAHVDAVTLRVLRDEQGKLNLLEIVRVSQDGSAFDNSDDENTAPGKNTEEEEEMFEILPISPIPPPEAPNGESMPPTTEKHAPHVVDCHGMPLSLCKLQYLIREKVAAMHRVLSGMTDARQHSRPCGGMGRRPHGPPGLPIKGGVPKFTRPDGTPIMHKGHRFHHHHHHGIVHKTFRFARRFFFGFVVPVMIGVAAGMTASLAGMVVGTGIAMLWFRIKRGGKHGQQGDVAAEEGEQFEREGLMAKEEEALAEPRDSEETLPAYEEKESQME